jgi:hypothetical protein
MDQLVASDGGHDRLEIGDDGGALSFEGDPAEAGDQRLSPSVSLHGDLEASPGPPICVLMACASDWVPCTSTTKSSAKRTRR